MERDDQYSNYISNQLGFLHNEDFTLMSRYFHKNYARFLQDRNKRILDVGCGMGHFLYFLHTQGFHNVTGIDLSKECIEFCQSKGLGSPENLHQLGIKDFLSEQDHGFDVIVLNDVIEHFPKDQVISNLQLIRKSLNEDGCVIIKVINSANPITGAGSRYYDFTHTISFTEESLSQVMRMAGYKQILIIPQDIWIFNPLVNVFGRSLQGLFNSFFRALNLLYGRKTTRIFTKDLIAVGYC